MGDFDSDNSPIMVSKPTLDTSALSDRAGYSYDSSKKDFFVRSLNLTTGEESSISPAVGFRSYRDDQILSDKFKDFHLHASVEDKENKSQEDETRLNETHLKDTVQSKAEHQKHQMPCIPQLRRIPSKNSSDTRRTTHQRSEDAGRSDSNAQVEKPRRLDNGTNLKDTIVAIGTNTEEAIRSDLSKNRPTSSHTLPTRPSTTQHRRSHMAPSSKSSMENVITSVVPRRTISTTVDGSSQRSKSQERRVTKPRPFTFATQQRGETRKAAEEEAKGMKQDEVQAPRPKRNPKRSLTKPLDFNFSTAKRESARKALQERHSQENQPVGTQGVVQSSRSGTASETVQHTRSARRPLTTPQAPKLQCDLRARRERSVERK